MRNITHLVVHCSATKHGIDIGAAEIRKWHMQGNGWRDIGYHFVIRLDGTIETGRPLEQVGAHVTGHNANTIGICLVGGLDANMKPSPAYTNAQYESLATLLTDLKAKFPRAKILGHRDFPGVRKDCPCFNARQWAATMGLAA